MTGGENGYAMLWAVVALAALAVLAASAVALPMRTAAEFTAFHENMEQETLLETALAEIIEALQADPNAQSDAPGDPLWNRVRNGFGGIEVSVKDVSSGINPNAISLEILNDEELRTKFRYFTAPADLKQRIVSEGFFTTPEELQDYLPRSSLENLFTLYGLWNPAVSDQVSLERLIAERTGSAETAAVPASALAAAGLQSKKANRAEYRSILGDAAEALRPLITDEPLINVHFADADLLRIILGMEFDGKSLPDPDGALGRITAARLSGEIMPASLRAMIDIEEGQEAVFEILGTKTWFWEITVESDDGLLVAVAARIPPPDDGGRPDFQIVSRRFERGDS